MIISRAKSLCFVPYKYVKATGYTGSFAVLYKPIAYSLVSVYWILKCIS